MKCILCGNDIVGRGHNAAPVASGVCCDICNNKTVVPRRTHRFGVFIPSEGRAKPYEIKNIGTLMELNDLQEAVGGYIQTVTVESSRGAIILVDEEGKLKKKPINPTATQLVKNSLFEGDYISGDALYILAEGDNFGYLSYDTAKRVTELINDLI